MIFLVKRWFQGVLWAQKRKRVSGKRKLTQNTCTLEKEMVLLGQIITSKLSGSLEKDIAMRMTDNSKRQD